MDDAARFRAILDARERRAAARAATVAERLPTAAELLAARREEMGRLLDLLAAHSTGGFVLIRCGLAHHSRQEWRVNVRHAGREYTHTGRELGLALYRAAYRLCYGRPPAEET